MKTYSKIILFTILCCVSFTTSSKAQDKDLKAEIAALRAYNESLNHQLDKLFKKIDDITWFERVGDIAYVDKVYMYGPPKWKEENPNALGAGNPVKFWSYIFIPKDLDTSKKYPLIVFPHGGVHGDFTTYYTHIIRELVSQNYVVVAAEYRGSTGYGEGHYKKIDYGGLEIEDVFASKEYMLENYDFLDTNRVGIIGWSHGGLLTLMNIFNHPDDYKVAYAGVPVSDLVSRMGYMDQDYRDLYEADHHIGASAQDNLQEYRRRSPAWNTHKMGNTPLMITTNTIDDDVNVLEVEHLIKSLKADNKKFDYKVYEAVPGGHSFDRMDTKKAKEIRLKMYKFLTKYLRPEKPIKSLKELHKAGYKY
ncbi:prolyl oligopeptidase family protein [Balneicella halophila]|uniref:Prolyl oligopeptidase family protein n=1 Tax=Balneicella halophila TaxID=1537566 RepID=A0A7L4UQH3_BALHA|nr:prolyl oligopeptidase family serine peptidase [Balneicella halophila]PVX52025.1 prolyl oligopeptidase family protein [Balneicella halophila]